MMSSAKPRLRLKNWSTSVGCHRQSHRYRRFLNIKLLFYSLKIEEKNTLNKILEQFNNNDLAHFNNVFKYLIKEVLTLILILNYSTKAKIYIIQIIIEYSCRKTVK